MGNCTRDGDDGAIATMILLNGAPGVGKSTLAQRVADARALVLVVDIDTLRAQLGQWQRHDRSKLVARDLAIALARAHLEAGFDVIVPQYIEQVAFIDRLATVASEATAEFAEFLVTDDVATVVDRFGQRRAEQVDAVPHPESDMADDDIASTVRGALDRLATSARARGIGSITLERGLDAALERMLATLDSLG